ncbi:MAG TPA: hypothetical protein VMH82_08365 [Myxococcota bacterium]|nr:hypothetical protein [Myxococcota bacterium]
MPEFGLGAYLVQRGVLSRDQLEQALQSQVVYGGRIGTNLVELGLLSLDAVAGHLAASLGYPLPPKAWLEEPDAMALAALPRELVERRLAIPLRLDADGLHVALLDPSDARVQAELSRAARRPVVPYVLPELRLRYVLERHLGIARPLRYLNVARRLERVRRRAAGDDEKLPEEVRLRAELGIRPLAADEDLIDESGFVELHSRFEAMRERALGGPPVGEAAELVLDEVLPDEPEAEPPDASADARSLEEALARASDRDAAARVAIALARRHAQTAVLFVVHRGVVMGLVGEGEEPLPPVQGILVPADSESVFARVAARGEPFRGAPPESGLDLRVLRALGRHRVKQLAVLPIAIRGRVVNLLYADDGPRALAETSLGALHALTVCIARTYEQLILKRKRAS